jgi:hypothetical protein
VTFRDLSLPDLKKSSSKSEFRHVELCKRSGLGSDRLREMFVPLWAARTGTVLALAAGTAALRTQGLEPLSGANRAQKSVIRVGKASGRSGWSW